MSPGSFPLASMDFSFLSSIWYCTEVTADTWDNDSVSTSWSADDATATSWDSLTKQGGIGAC